MGTEARRKEETTHITELEKPACESRSLQTTRHVTLWKRLPQGMDPAHSDECHRNTESLNSGTHTLREDCWWHTPAPGEYPNLAINRKENF